MSKIVSLIEAGAIVENGQTIALGGNVLHRTPMAYTRELARQKKRNLTIVKTAGAHDIDLLCAVHSVSAVHAGFVSYETRYGLAGHYRQAVQSGKVKANEHACYTVICALRAASMNVPFMPVHGLNTGDLLVENDYFLVVEDPFDGEPVTLVKAIVPDVAVIHVEECDSNGNAVIHGPKYEDTLMSRAAKKVIITTEQVVSKSKMRLHKDKIDIPGFLVEAVVHIPKGASPSSCNKKYDADKKSLETFISLKTTGEIREYLDTYKIKDYAGTRRTDQW